MKTTLLLILFGGATLLTCIQSTACDQEFEAFLETSAPEEAPSEPLLAPIQTVLPYSPSSFSREKITEICEFTECIFEEDGIPPIEFHSIIVNSIRISLESPELTLEQFERLMTLLEQLSRANLLKDQKLRALSRTITDLEKSSSKLNHRKLFHLIRKGHSIEEIIKLYKKSK